MGDRSISGATAGSSEPKRSFVEPAQNGREAVANREEALLNAAAARDESAVSEALRNRVNVKAKNKSGQSALDIWADADGGSSTIQALLGAGSQFSSPTGSYGQYKWTGLHWAARFGETKEARRLLSLGADPNARADAGWTPLALCAFCAGPELIGLLSAAGADHKATLDEGSSLFSIAVGHGNTVFTEWCLESQAMSGPPEQEIGEAIRRLEKMPVPWDDEAALLERLRALREGLALESQMAVPKAGRKRVRM